MTEVSKDIPIPERGEGNTASLRGLQEVGDSVLIKCPFSSIGTLALRVGLTGKYTARKQSEGVYRVWRTKL